MRDQYATRPSAFLHPSGDVHIVPEDVVRLHVHIAEIYSDTKSQLRSPTPLSIPVPHGILEHNREPNCPRRARELSQEPISSVLNDPRAVMNDLWRDDIPINGHTARVHPGLVFGHTSRVRDGIGGENDGQSIVARCNHGAGIITDPWQERMRLPLPSGQRTCFQKVIGGLVRRWDVHELRWPPSVCPA